jgi:hypothetical protein
MKLADGLELIKSMGREKARLEGLGRTEGWEYRTQEHPNAKWQPTFDLEKNHEAVKDLDKKIRKLSRAINATNNLCEIAGIDDNSYRDWL